MKNQSNAHQTAIAACRAMLDGTVPPEQLIGPPTPRGLVRYGQDGSRNIAPDYVAPTFKRREETRIYVVMVLNS